VDFLGLEWNLWGPGADHEHGHERPKWSKNHKNEVVPE
jgi:hypothetical protein